MTNKFKIELELEFTTHWDGDAKVEVADIPAIGVKTQASFENIERAAHSAAQNWLQICLDRGLIARWKNECLAASQPGEPGKARCPKCGGVNLALYSCDDGFMVGYCNAPSCKYKGEFWGFFRPSAPSPQKHVIDVIESDPPAAPNKYQVFLNGREIVAFDYSHEAYSVAGNLRMALRVAPSGSAGPEPIPFFDECEYCHATQEPHDTACPKYTEPDPPAEPSAEAKGPEFPPHIEYNLSQIKRLSDVAEPAEPAVVSASPEPEPQMCRPGCTWPTCGCSSAAQPVAADLPHPHDIAQLVFGVAGEYIPAHLQRKIEELLLQHADKAPFPKTCELCKKTIETQESTFYHGLGECVPICPTCFGTGIEPSSLVAADQSSLGRGSSEAGVEAVNLTPAADQTKLEEVASELYRRFGFHSSRVLTYEGALEFLRPYFPVSQTPTSVIEAATQLLDAMESCHICKAQVLLEETPVHCEDCSADCEGHDEPECQTIKALHANLRRIIKQLAVAPLSGNGPEDDHKFWADQYANEAIKLQARVTELEGQLRAETKERMLWERTAYRYRRERENHRKRAEIASVSGNGPEPTTSPEDVPDLYRLAYMPGVWRCPKCEFVLSKATISMSSGTIGTTPEDRQSEECPNDGTFMLPVTYKESLKQCQERLIRELERAGAASHNGQGWVRMEDGLPKKRGQYWCWLSDLGGRGCEMFFSVKQEQWSFNGGKRSYAVTHWQPLPAPPSEANVPRPIQEEKK